MQSFYNQLSHGASHRTSYQTFLLRLTQASRAQLSTWQTNAVLGWSNWG